MYKTVEDILHQVYRTYEGDVDYPEFTDEDTQYHFGLLLDGIDEWLNRFPEYRETFTSLNDAADGDKITTTATTYNCPTNFVRPANTVKVGDKHLTYIPPEQIGVKLQQNSGSEWFSIIGRPGAYKLRINPAPQSGLPIEYDYYRKIAYPTTAADPIEISRPLFLFNYIMSILVAEDDEQAAMKYVLAMNEQERLERVELAKTSGEPNQLAVAGAGFDDTSSSVANIVTDQ